jgi:hypothetical protein
MFSKVIVDKDWIRRAAALPGKSFVVAFACVEEASKTGENPIYLLSPILKAYDIKRDALRRAIKHLVEARLVHAVKLGRNMCYMVKLLGALDDQEMDLRP